MVWTAATLCLSVSFISAAPATLHHAKHFFDASQTVTGVKPKVAILSAYYGSSLRLANVTRPNKQGYASQHGYHFEDAYAEDTTVKAFVDDALSKGGMGTIKDQSAQ